MNIGKPLRNRRATKSPGRARFADFLFSLAPFQAVCALMLKVRAIFRRSALDRELSDEMQFHIAEARDELIRNGCPPAEAEYQVRKRFGNVTRLREETRDAWLLKTIEDLWRDAAYALRMFQRKPGVTAVVIAVLAFGIGINTAVFCVVDCVLLRPLPYPSPDSLVVINERFARDGKVSPDMPVNGGNYLLWARESKTMTGIALLDSEDADFYLRGGTVHVSGMSTTANLFSLLGVKPYLGRFPAAAQDRMGNGLSIVLTYRFWKRQFGGDPSIVGKTLRLSGFDSLVVGVLPESFYFPRRTELDLDATEASAKEVDFFGNFNMQPYQQQPGMEMFNYIAIGRLRPGVSAHAAASELDAIEKQVPGTGAVRLAIALTPLKGFITGPTTKSIRVCLGGALLLLLLVGVNVAGVLLSKSFGRTQEVAIRISMGAGRRALLRQFLTEGLLLALAGGLLGSLAAWAGVHLLVSAAPAALPRVETITIDPRFFAVAFATSTLTGLVVSFVPALRLLQTGSADALKAGAKAASAGGVRLRTHQALAAGEVALCTVLLICACLAAKSFAKVLDANRPLESEFVLTTDIAPPPNPYNDLHLRRNLFTRLTREAATIPGVQSAGISSALPATGETWVSSTRFKEDPNATKIEANFRFISPGYPAALGLALLAGRQLRETDTGHPMALISRSVAARLPRTLNPVGTHFAFYDPNNGKVIYLEVAGIVDDIRASPEKPAPAMLYVPYWEWPPWMTSLVIRTSDPAAVRAHLRTVIRETDSRLALNEVRTMQRVLDEAVAPRRYLSELSSVFALSAGFLALLGVYGLVTLCAVQRTREIGIRIAVGAQRGQIFALLLSQAARPTAAGATAGLFLAFLAGHLLQPLLYETSGFDPAIYLIVTAALLTVALLASSLPARRALRVDPVSALKCE